MQSRTSSTANKVLHIFLVCFEQLVPNTFKLVLFLGCAVRHCNAVAPHGHEIIIKLLFINLIRSP